MLWKLGHTETMKTLKRLVLGTLVGLVSGTVYAVPLHIPLEFSGSFLWEGEDTSQAVKMQLGRATRLPNNELLLEGTAYYDKTCSVIFRSRINRLTLTFTQTESLLKCQGGVDQGQYRGEISSDFKRFKATWTGRDGARGTLRMNASSSAYIAVGEVMQVNR